MAGNLPDTTALSLARLPEILIERRQPAVRLTEKHYPVQFQPQSDMWCVINMAGLDERAEICSRFRFRKSCDHVDLVSKLCSQENQAICRTPR